MNTHRLKKNISWIFFGNVIHAVLAFLLNIYVARVLSLNDNGLLNYAASIISLLTSLGTLGFGSVITKFFSEDNENAEAYLGTCITYRCLLAVVLIIALQIFVRISSPLEKELHLIVFCQSLTLLFGSLDLLVYWYRFENLANVVAILRIVAFFVSALWRVLALSVFHSLQLYVLGVSMETCFFDALLLYYFCSVTKHRLAFKHQLLKPVLRVSYSFIFSSLLISIYAQADKMMLKSMVSNDAVALYSVAATVAGCIAIIPQSLIEAFRPDILELKRYDEKLYQKRLSQLYGIIFWICIVYGVFITLFAKPIILILYGNKYIGAVPALSLIVWYTSFSYFGAINNLYMVAENKVKWVKINTLCGALLNVILNYVLIPIYGVAGAALASLLTQFVANFIMMWLVKDLRNGFFIMVRGILLKNTFRKRKRSE